MTSRPSTRQGRRTVSALVGLALVGLALFGGAALISRSDPVPSPPDAAEQAVRAATGKPVARFAVAGDVGTGGAAERRTAGAAEARAGTRGWDALVLLGDNIYDDGDPARAKEAVFDPFRQVLQPGVPLLAALGNHDSGSGNGPGQLDALGQPGPWFARRLGPALIVVLDSNRPDDARQLAWLSRTLAEDDAAWTVAVMHHPMHSAGRHGSDEDVRRSFAPLFKKHGVQLALAGHDHDYERTRAIDGTTYVVSGAAAKLRPAGSNTETLVSQSVYHFLDVSVFEDRLVVEAVDQQGRVFDGVVLNAG